MCSLIIASVLESDIEFRIGIANKKVRFERSEKVTFWKVTLAAAFGRFEPTMMFPIKQALGIYICSLLYSNKA